MKKTPVKDKIKKVLKSYIVFKKMDFVPGAGIIANMTVYHVMSIKKEEIHLTEETMVDRMLDKIVPKMLSGEVVSMELAGKEVYVELEEVLDITLDGAGAYVWDKTGNKILCELKLYVKDLKTHDVVQEVMLEKKYINYMTVQERYNR